MTSQADYLNKARESPEKVISEIERTIIKRFTHAREIVRVKFKKIFAELFEGGTADLYLFDNEKPLDTGIEIIAQPPGKKLQSLSLLSGGERAMTAIALLFAILDYKPSPFCVLDEIDATLDEVNVHRFSLLLDLFSKQLQFIVVTHRRGTHGSGEYPLWGDHGRATGGIQVSLTRPQVQSGIKNLGYTIWNMTPYSLAKVQRTPGQQPIFLR